MASNHNFIDKHLATMEDFPCIQSMQPTNQPVKCRCSMEKSQTLNQQVSLDAMKSCSSNKEQPHSGKSLGANGDFGIFRTKPGLRKQNSMPLTRKDAELGLGDQEEAVVPSVPADRYFAALRGPEFDQIKDYEDTLLPKDEVWPFLLRFPIGCFGICLGLGSQTVLWGAISSSPAMDFIKVSPAVNLVLWLLALAILIAVSVTYTLKCALYFEAVRREFFHPVRVNFFFAPWIASMFLSIGAPPTMAPSHLHPFIWCAFAAPVFILDLKIYGQWFSGGKRRLCKVANPSSHLSVIGNFVGAAFAAKVNWIEAGKLMWAVGLAHYLVVFVTLYQRLPTNESLPKELHPVYSMFIALPSAASISWAALHHEFDSVSRIFYFISLFLYMSLLVRINFFRGFRFSVAWWSYTFPMTTAALAAVKYAEEVPCPVSKGVALSLSLVSSTMVTLLFISTLLHGLMWRTLFPNDLAIAITKKRSNKGKRPRPVKKSCNIKQWAKQTAPLSFVSFITKSNSRDHECNGK